MGGMEGRRIGNVGRAGFAAAQYDLETKKKGEKKGKNGGGVALGKLLTTFCLVVGVDSQGKASKYQVTNRF